MTAQTKLCVGTIFPDCGSLPQKWLDLQLRYLKAATSVPFTHISVVQHGSVTPAFSNNTHVIRPTSESRNSSTSHMTGLVALREYYKHAKHGSQYFLFLDMDAFPIRKDWFEILTARLDEKQYELAVALRTENLETRLHSSILFVRADAAHRLQWSWNTRRCDMFGDLESDVQLVSHQEGQRRCKVFTLLRSQMHQIHPLLCGIYFDMFYHHGCGSNKRGNLIMRGEQYWAHIIPPKLKVRQTIHGLMADPNKFIGRLVGWRKGAYVQV
jgi:hypothetical protein